MSVIVNCLIAPIVSMAMWGAIYLAMGPVALGVIVCVATCAIGLMIGYTSVQSMISEWRASRRDRDPAIS